MKTIRRFLYIFFQKFVLLLTVLIGSVVLLSPTIAHAADGDFVWAKGMGDIGQILDDRGYDIFVDAAGNVYTTGYFRGTVDFDPGPGTINLTSAGNSKDIFITKMNSGGNLVWAKAIGGVFSDEGWGIFADSTGNVYITGYFGGTVNFGSFPLISEGSSDIFISKLDSDGNYVGAWAMGGTTDDYGFGIFVDSTGNIFTTGYFKNTVDFDPGAGTFNLISSSLGVADIFICKLDSNGSFVWARRIGGAAADVGLGISLYSSGNIYITGYFQDTVDFNPEAGTFNLISAGSYDIFITKLNNDGNFVWAKAMGGLSDDRGQAVSVDTLGNVYTTGWFNLTADFDPGAGTALLTSTGIASDIFISKLDSGGNYIWARAMGGSSSADVGYGISIDASGSIYTTGSFQGTDVDFDPGTGTFNLTSAGNEDIFISKLNSSGIFVWAKAMGGHLADYGYDIAVTSTGAVHTTGYFRGTADFDPGPGTFSLVSAGFEDIFISKLAGPDPVIDTTFPWAMFLPAIIGKAQAQP